MRGVIEFGVSFTLGILINLLAKQNKISNEELLKYIEAKQNEIIVPAFGGSPTSSLALINGDLLTMSSPYFSGFAAYNINGLSIRPKLNVSCEVLSMMGVPYKHIEAMMLGSSVGSLIGGILTVSLASGPVGWILGGVAAVCGAIMGAFYYHHKRRLEITQHNLILAQNIGIAHMMLNEVASSFAESGLLGYSSEFNSKLLSLCQEFDIKDEINEKAGFNKSKLSLQDFAFVYDEYCKLIRGIEQLKSETGLLDCKVTDLYTKGISIEQILEVSPLPNKMNVELKRFGAIEQIVPRLVLRTSNGNTVLNDAGFSFTLPKADKSFKVIPESYPAVFHIEPLATTLYSTSYDNKLMESNFLAENNLELKIKNISSKARMLVQGTQGVHLLTPVIRNSINLEHTLSRVVGENDNLIVSSSSSPNYENVAVIDKGKAFRIPYVIRSKTKFSVFEVNDKGIYPPKTNCLANLSFKNRGEIVLLLMLGNRYLADYNLPSNEILELIDFIFYPYIAFGALFDEINETFKIGWFPTTPSVTYGINIVRNLNIIDYSSSDIRRLLGCSKLLELNQLKYISTEYNQTIANYSIVRSTLNSIFPTITLTCVKINVDGEDYIQLGDALFKNQRKIQIRQGVSDFPSNYATVSLCPDECVLNRISNFALASYNGSNRLLKGEKYEIFFN